MRRRGVYMHGSLVFIGVIGIFTVAAAISEMRWRWRFKQERAAFLTRVEQERNAMNQGARSTPYKLKV